MFAKKAPLWPIAGSRMLIGLLWLFSLRWKLPPDFVASSGRSLREWLELEVAYPAFAPYASLVEHVVLPNFLPFAWIIFLSELLVGLMLLLGGFTRLGAALGLLMSLNLGIGLLEVPGEWPWSYAMMVMWHAVFLVSAAGRVAGVDGLLRRRYASGWWRTLT